MFTFPATCVQISNPSYLKATLHTGLSRSAAKVQGSVGKFRHLLDIYGTCSHLLLHTHHVGLDSLSISRSSLINILASLI